MVPILASHNCGNGALYYSKHICDLLLIQFASCVQVPNLSYVALREFAFRVLFASYSSSLRMAQSIVPSVLHVLRTCDPLKVLKPIVVLDPVFVIAFISRCWGWASKSLKDKSMHQFGSVFAVGTEANLPVAGACFGDLSQVGTVNPYTAVGAAFPKSPYIENFSCIRDSIIAFAARNPCPVFHICLL